MDEFGSTLSFVASADGGLAIILWQGAPVYRRILGVSEGPNAEPRALILATLTVGLMPRGLLATHGHHSVFDAFGQCISKPHRAVCRSSQLSF